MINLIRKHKKNILYFLSVFCSASTIIFFYSYSIETKKINAFRLKMFVMSPTKKELFLEFVFLSCNFDLSKIDNSPK